VICEREWEGKTYSKSPITGSNPLRQERMNIEIAYSP
jgi:hypothetical protein